MAFVSNIMKVLCDNQCCLEFEQLGSILRRSSTVDEKLLRVELLNNENFRVVEEDSAKRALSPGTLIIATTPLRVCKDQATCARCAALHLCRYLVCGNCRFGNKCKNSHDLKSAHNSVLLKNKNLHFLEEAQLFQLLLQNDPSLVPEICSHYNKGNGVHGSCKYQTSCTSLHVCQHFLHDDCKFGATCKRAHNFGATALNILNGRGFSPENIHTLQKIYKNKFLSCQTDKPISKGAERGKQVNRQCSSGSVSETDCNEICLFYVRKGCSFKDKCVRVHHDMPYKWEILDKDELTWEHFPNEEDVERAYCDPANDKSFGLLPVEFTLMKCGGRQVRRLSTASSVIKPPHFILTTKWLWYWKNDEGQWIEYGQGEYEKHLKSISSKALENVYLSEIENEIPFSLGGNDYVLNIKDMYQQNLRYKTKREVRRRPKFVSVQDVKGESKSDAPETTSFSTEEVPGHWDKAALPSFSYMTVPLSRSATDYGRVTQLFKHTMFSSTIHSIERVQNPSLWKVFQWQKDQMKKRSGKEVIDEQYLFHGTDKSHIDAICEQNFDWRVCGVHGSLYGKGSYFAKDAKYSDRFAKPTGGTKMMFVALVLVGEYTNGSSHFLRPPQKSQQAGFYDSCVDNTSRPTIFVIFEKYQIYPEYIIEYS